MKLAMLRYYSAIMQQLNWDDLRFLLALARSGRLAPAADRLGVNETTVSRRLAALQNALGTRLFERVAGQYHATPAGAAVLRHAEQIEQEIDRLSGSLTGADARVTGQVRLTSVPIIVHRILIPALPPLIRQHPALELELLAEPQNLSLTKRDADLALRLARPQQEPRILTRRLGRVDYAVYAKASVGRNGLPWITYDEARTGLPQAVWMDQAAKASGNKSVALRVNDAEAVLHAVEAGLGKSLLPCAIGDRREGLVRLDAPRPTPSRELWLLVHPELRRLARIRAVIDWIEETLARTGI